MNRKERRAAAKTYDTLQLFKVRITNQVRAFFGSKAAEITAALMKGIMENALPKVVLPRSGPMGVHFFVVRSTQESTDLKFGIELDMDGEAAVVGFRHEFVDDDAVKARGMKTGEESPTLWSGQLSPAPHGIDPTLLDQYFAHTKTPRK